LSYGDTRASQFLADDEGDFDLCPHHGETGDGHWITIRQDPATQDRAKSRFGDAELCHRAATREGDLAADDPFATGAALGHKGKLYPVGVIEAEACELVGQAVDRLRLINLR
jgi:hypothetical protein